MNEIYRERFDGTDETVVVRVDDTERSAAGDSPSYEIVILRPGEEEEVSGDVRFQFGPVRECGVNGVTSESLIAILLHRLRAFQSGPYACRENALAITRLEEGLHWLNHRTQERRNRGVEGTHSR